MSHKFIRKLWQRMGLVGAALFVLGLIGLVWVGFPFGKITVTGILTVVAALVPFLIDYAKSDKFSEEPQD